MKQADDIKTLELPLDGSPVKRKPGRKPSGNAKSDARRAAEYRARQKLKPRPRPVRYEELTQTTLDQIARLVQLSTQASESERETLRDSAWGMFALWNVLTSQSQHDADRRRMERMLASAPSQFIRAIALDTNKGAAALLFVNT